MRFCIIERRQAQPAQALLQRSQVMGAQRQVGVQVFEAAVTPGSDFAQLDIGTRSGPRHIVAQGFHLQDQV